MFSRMPRAPNGSTVYHRCSECGIQSPCVPCEKSSKSAHHPEQKAHDRLKPVANITSGLLCQNEGINSVN
jgi:hypothetical protein